MVIRECFPPAWLTDLAPRRRAAVTTVVSQQHQLRVAGTIDLTFRFFAFSTRQAVWIQRLSFSAVTYIKREQKNDSLATDYVSRLEPFDPLVLFVCFPGPSVADTC